MENSMYELKETFIADVEKYRALVANKTGSESLFYIVPQGDHMRVAKKDDRLMYDLHAGAEPVLASKTVAFRVARKFMQVAKGNHEIISEAAWNFRKLRASEDVVFALAEAEKNDAA